MSALPTINRDRSGQTDSNDPGMTVTIAIRRAAANGMETRPPSDGNKEAVASAPPVGASKKTTPDKPAKASDKGNEAAKEPTPPFAKESLAGDGWQRARAAARKMHRSK